MRTLLLAILLLDTSPKPQGFSADSCGLMRTLVPHKGYAYAAAFSNRFLATGGADNKIVLLRLGSWEHVRTLSGHTSAVQGLAFSRNGSVLVSRAMHGSVRVWDVETGREVHQFREKICESAAISPDGKTVAVGEAGGRVTLWEIESRNLRTLNVHPPSVPALAFSGDGKLLAIASGNGTVRLWDTEKRRQVRMIEVSERGISSIAFSRDGERLFVAGSIFVIHEYEVESGKKKASMKGHPSQITAMAPTPDGRYLVSAGNVTVRLWDLKRHTEAAQLTHHRSPIQGLAVSRDGKYIASAALDMHVKVWGKVPGGTTKLRPHGFFGVTIQEDAAAVKVLNVLAGTAAKKAGVQGDDIILKVEGVEVGTVAEAIAQISRFLKGDEVEILLRRGDRNLTMKVKLGERPKDAGR